MLYTIYKLQKASHSYWSAVICPVLFLFSVHPQSFIQTCNSKYPSECRENCMRWSPCQNNVPPQCPDAAPICCCKGKNKDAFNVGFIFQREISKMRYVIIVVNIITLVISVI